MAFIQRWLRWASLVLGLLLLWNAVTMTPATTALWRLMFTRLRQEGAFGVGVWDGNANVFDFGQLEPGDIVLGGNTGSSWGDWTHAALYLGNGEVMETFLQTGATPEPVSRYNNYYSHAGALRVKLPKAVKEQAVAEARRLVGKPFYLLAPRNSTSLFYCSKVVWYAYKRAGVDIEPDHAYWIIPDRITQSEWVEPIQPSGR
jgi:uncharacterized protein YycO